MSDIILSPADYDRWLSLSEKAERDGVIASDDAFVAAMQNAIKRKREKVKPGTYVDATAAVGARRISGIVQMSSGCGSPAGSRCAT